MERPKIQMLVDDGEEEELVELAAPSADAAIRLKLGDTFWNTSEKPFKSKTRDIVALDRSNLNLKKSYDRDSYMTTLSIIDFMGL